MRHTSAAVVLAGMAIVGLAACSSSGSGSSTATAQPPATSAPSSPVGTNHGSTYKGPSKTLGAYQEPSDFQIPSDFQAYSTDYCPGGVFSETEAPCAAHAFAGWQVLFVPGQSMKLDARQTSDLFASKLSAAGWKTSVSPIDDGTYQGYASHETFVDAQAPAGSGFDLVHIRIFKSDQPGNGTSVEIYFTKGGFCAANAGPYPYVCPAQQ